MICLNMIVKNEAARIERCLASVAPHISTWVICDTGSEDGTQAKIRDFFGAREIPGLLFNIPWLNFGETRNEALNIARSNPRVPEFEYLLLCDADMELFGEFGELTAPAYLLEQRSASLRYWNVRLVRHDVPARYVGVTHEYLSVEGSVNLASAWFQDHADGANRPGKAERDAALLKAAVTQDPTDARSWFYLGNSLKDLGRLDEAAVALRKRVELGGWDEEVWHSGLTLSRMERAQNGPQSTHSALKTWHDRPSRLEPLADLAKYYREIGMNEVALMFAKRGLAASEPTGDLLFVENAREELANTFAICAYYSDPETRAKGAEICDRLSLNRNVARETRELARANLYWYLRPINEFLPSWQARRLSFDPPPGYRQMSPSITRHGRRIMIAERTVNYWIEEERLYCTADGAPIHSRTFLLELDRETMADSPLGEITLPGDFPSAVYHSVVGFEDTRLVSQGGELWTLSAVREQNEMGLAEQWLGRLGANLEMQQPHPIRLEGEPRYEKNWIPLIDRDTLKFIYLCDPTRLINKDGAAIKETMPAIACEHFSGGSQAIQFMAGWLAVVHSHVQHGIYRRYHHRFVWFDSEFNLERWSRPFTFPVTNYSEVLHGYQFAIGLCWHPDENRLLLSYQIDESQSWVGVFNHDDVRQFLNLDCPPAQKISAFDDDLWWVLKQTNQPLQYAAANDRATAMLSEAGLPHHHDRTKNWDTYLGLVHCVQNCASSDAILDAAGTRESAFLPGLVKLGYRKLINLNLYEPNPGIENGITWAWGDITRSGFNDGAFRFIMCQSVLEHDVDWRLWLKETARILASGGHVFVSVDYWEAPIVTDVKIFAAAEIYELIKCAAEHGLRLIGTLDYRCLDKVIHWYGNDYTFLNFLLRRD
jgi:glycosyltransferase involved in cell wall biosynthesis